jgi:hypothetical protein
MRKPLILNIYSSIPQSLLSCLKPRLPNYPVFLDKNNKEFDDYGKLQNQTYLPIE